MGNKTKLEYHIVLVSKYRKPVFDGIEDSVLVAVRNAARNGKFEILEMAVDLGNHLHLVVRADPTVSVAQLVRRLKQLTTLELWSTQENRLGKFYWGKKRKLWSGGYFAGTVGAVSREAVLDYVRRQSY